MKKKLIWIVAIIAVIVLLACWAGGSYNTMAQLRNGVDESFGQVQVQYQRRADLIPNLVETVKGYANYEESVLTAVTEARAGIANAETPAELTEAGRKLDDAIGTINVVVEAYPELKANETYVSLMDELAGTENRIAAARQDYNETVKTYNAAVITFPRNLLAGIFGFQKTAYFEADTAAQTAPQVNFN